jgi:hypothetical protein
VTWHADNRDLARVVQYELRSLDSEHLATISTLRRATSRIFKRIIKEGNQSGEFDTLDVEAATLAITSLGVDVSRWFPSQTFSNSSILAHRYVELALRMVGSR